MEDVMAHQRFVRSLYRSVAAAVCIAASILGTGITAWGEDQKSFGPREIISARKTLMSVIAKNMYPLDEMIYTGQVQP